MKRTLEFVGKKVDDVIKEGCKKLGVSLGDENVDIKIVSQGGLFKKAKVLFILGTDDEPAPVAADTQKQDKKAALNQEPKPAPQKPAPQKPDNTKTDSAKTDNTKTDKPRQRDSRDEANGAVQRQEKHKRKNDDAPATVNAGNQRKDDGAPKAKAPVVPAVRIETPPQGSQTAQADAPKKHKDKFNRNKPQQKRDEQASNGDLKQERNSPKRKPEKKFEDKPIVSAPPSEEHLAKCNAFLTELLERTGIAGKADITVDNGINVVIETTDSAIIGYRGEMLDSIQYLAGLIVNGSDNKRIRVSVDAMDYRQKRIDTLIRLANKMAEKAIANKRKVSLEPMNSAERRIIHAALSENEGVITRSEGHEPNRRIVILAKR